MASNKRLICLAKFTRKFHLFLFALAVITWPLSLISSSNPILERARGVGMVYVLGLIAGTALGQLLFQGDCPLTVLEFCLRGLGGEKFSHSRLRTMTELYGRGMAPRDIYRRLLWRSGIYTLLVGMAIIATTILVPLTF